jgi:hypothetical protein
MKKETKSKQKMKVVRRTVTLIQFSPNGRTASRQQTYRTDPHHGHPAGPSRREAHGVPVTLVRNAQGSGLFSPLCRGTGTGGHRRGDGTIKRPLGNRSQAAARSGESGQKAQLPKKRYRGVSFVDFRQKKRRVFKRLTRIQAKPERFGPTDQPNHPASNPLCAPSNQITCVSVCFPSVQPGDWFEYQTSASTYEAARF